MIDVMHQSNNLFGAFEYFLYLLDELCAVCVLCNSQLAVKLCELRHVEITNE